MAKQNEHPVNLFCAFAPEDEHFYQELALHFSLLRSRGFCTLRHAGDIPAGGEWEQTLISLIDQAGLVLVLLSPDYFTSVFSVNGALQDLLARKAQQGCLIPLLLRPCVWQDSLFRTLTPLPRDGSTISTKAQRDAAWLSIVEEMRPRITHFAADVASTGAGSQMTQGNAGIWLVPYRRNPFFTGRDELMATLHERQQATSVPVRTRMLAISGLGGIGKTQVALEYAYRYCHNYSAILWVTAETPEMLLDDFARLAEQLDLSTHLEQKSDELVSLLEDWLNRHRNWLLIFDNADTIELVRDYLPAEFRSNGQILLTTRATTAGGLAEMVQVEEMRGLEGELLLLRRAGLLATEAPLEQASEQIRSNAAQIVTELDGLPLGIDQAGAYIAETGCSLAHYLRLFLQCRARLLAQRGKLPPGHPEPVATTWKLSFRRIEHTAAADLLRLCAFLAPDSIPEAIFLKGAPVLGPRLAQFAVDPLALDVALATLRNYSFIKRNPDSGTISLHRLVQAVLRDTLKPAQQRTWADRAIRALGKAVPESDTTLWQAWQPYLPQVSACVQLIDAYNLISEDAGTLLNQTGTMLRHSARYLEAEKMYERALRIYEQVLGSEHPDTAMILDNKATLLGIQRKYEQAVQLYERALRIRERVLGPAHPDTASTINGLALLYSNWHKYEESQHLYERALSIREQVLGPEHPDTATTLDNLAMLYRQHGKYEQAELLFKRALHIREGSLGPKHSMTASTLNNLAVLYRLQGNYEQAKPLFERALQIRERILGPEHPAIATTISNLAYLSRLQGQYEQSLRLYEQALHIREQAFGSEHPNATITCLNIGELYQEMGADEQAEDAIRHALLTHEQALGGEHPRVVNILEVYIRLLHHLGRDEEAMRFEERVQANQKR